MDLGPKGRFFRFHGPRSCVISCQSSVVSDQSSVSPCFQAPPGNTTGARLRLALIAAEKTICVHLRESADKNCCVRSFTTFVVEDVFGVLSTDCRMFCGMLFRFFPTWSVEVLLVSKSLSFRFCGRCASGRWSVISGQGSVAGFQFGSTIADCLVQFQADFLCHISGSGARIV
jgi:hypothetical protein